MANENELRELSERIARLSRRELVRLLDLALDVEDRFRAQIQAENLAAEAVLKEAEKPLREENQPVPFPPEAKREAG